MSAKMNGSSRLQPWTGAEISLRPRLNKYTIHVLFRFSNNHNDVQKCEISDFISN